MAGKMLGMTLVTHQTGPKGRLVRRLYIEEGASIAKEYYLSLLVDRETSRVAVVASTEGGMDIEEVAHSTPERIHTFTIDPATGVWPHHGLRAGPGAGPDGRDRQAGARAAADALQGLRREGHEPAGDQPADRHRRAAI